MTNQATNFLRAQAQKNKIAAKVQESEKFDSLVNTPLNTKSSVLAWSSDEGLNSALSTTSESVILDEGMTVAELEYWWSCLRKNVFRSLGGAKAAQSHYEGTPEYAKLEAYACPYHEHYHNGRRAEGSGTGFSLGEKRKQWRKWRDRPTVEDLKASYAKATNF